MSNARLADFHQANVSVSFFPIEILPAIFRYGYAMPFYNVSRTVRAILFNTRNQSEYPDICFLYSY